MYKALTCNEAKEKLCFVINTLEIYKENGPIKYSINELYDILSFLDGEKEQINYNIQIGKRHLRINDDGTTEFYD